MALRRLEATLVLVVIAAAAAMMSTAAQVQQTAAQPTFPTLPSCPPAPLSLSPCIGYVFGVGSATLDKCCSQLRSFAQAQAPCLCAASKLAPSPVGLLLGQAQGMIPNICNLPNPCDVTAGESTAPPEEATPAGTDTSSPATTATTPVAPAGGQVPSSASTTPSATPASTTPAAETANTPDAADPDYDDNTPAVETTPGQAAPPGTGLKKLPELLHAAGATSSRDTSIGTLVITLFLASVATIYV